ncbi:MAG TPA: VWA domain-containing protein [Limnochordia bacterium]|nr:VWA domain-containing protein [Limnochordia bacterium]
MIQFASPWFLLLIPAAVYLFWPHKKKAGLKFSSVKLLQRGGKTKTIKHKIGKTLVLCGVILALTALARPQSAEQADFIQKKGIDIVVLLDVSGSMESVDFRPNRLEVAKETIDSFIRQRVSDRIGLVIFAGEAFTRMPLTLDHNVVRESLASVTTASVNQDGTAIGLAIAVGLNRLKKSEAASKIMILVTDGENNAGSIDPATAANLAQEMGIKIYTIGVGSDRMILPVRTVFGGIQYQQYEGGFNESLLKQIAETTGGRYYRAAEPKALEQIFHTIDELEKTEFEDANYKQYRELAFPLLQAALVALAAGAALDKFRFVQIP